MTRQAITTDDGQQIAVRILDRQAPDAAADDQTPDARARARDGDLVAVLLHATLSTSEQLLPLARRLTARFRVVLIDRRGTADSPMRDPAPVPVARHVADVIAVLDALDVDRAVVVGHSFGGVVALRVAAEHPDRVAAVVAWEPPYLAVADERLRTGMAAMADAVASEFASGGAQAAAHRFLDAVSGAGAWDALHPRQRESIARQGGGALADVAMRGLTTDGLERISATTTIATGAASDAFYAPIADALAERIGPLAARVDLPDLGHMAPITDVATIAELVLRFAAAPAPQEATP